jgi:hypothetical protein
MPTVIDNKTSNYAIPLPTVSNRLVDDIARLSSALFTIDLVLALKQDQSTVGAVNGVATLDSSGRLTSTQLPALTGDVTLTAGSTVLTLSNTGVTAGTYNSVTVDTKGRVTSGTTASSSTLQPTGIITTNYTASVYQLIKASTVDGIITIILPSTPIDGAMIGIVDVGNHCGFNAVTIQSGAGDTINFTSSQVLNNNGMCITYVYIATSTNWQIYSTSLATSGSTSGFNGVETRLDGGAPYMDASTTIIIDGGSPITVLGVQNIDGGSE